MPRTKKTAPVEPTEQPAAVEETAPVAASYKVYGANGEFIREYLIEEHGENAKFLAEQFAIKRHGTVR